ncbi:MAG TPA: iron-containing redox enzyme family protein, partial [Candidatus Binatia bacterium]|nr:iron-containing redox enzyme family protein [Candidatus Binatia bacterium]
VNRTRFYNEPMTLECAKMFVRQHRQNTRQRNSVLKLSVATNCPDWETRIKIIEACSQEIIADHEYGHGKSHWEVIEELGQSIGMTLDEIRDAELLQTTRLAWLAWETLTKNRHWLEGLMANTCAERVNVPGYGTGRLKEVGWSGAQRDHWRKAFGLGDDQLEFWSMHTEADIEHSNLGWQTVAKYAGKFNMEDAIVEACRVNLMVWQTYWEGILDASKAVAKNGAAVAR